MKRAMRAALYAGVGMAAVMAASAALAADGDADQTVKTVDEVVVTAQKRAERLLEVPLPVQAVTNGQLAKAGVSNVSDVVKLVPGASIVSGATPGFETVQIRGIASGTTGDGLVGYYIGDTPFGVPNLQLTPPARILDLERIEVIRGPSATLYGQGSMGGTIKMVLAKPNAQEFSGKVQGETSTTDGGGQNYNADLVLNIPLVKDKFAARLALGYDSLSGYAEAPELNKSNVNDFKGKNARLGLAWTPNEDVTVSGLFWTVKNRQDFSNSLTPHNALSAIPYYFPVPYGFPAIAGTGGRQGFTNVDMDLASVTLNWSTALGELTVNSAHIRDKLDYVTPLLSILVNDSTFVANSDTNEIRLASRPSSPVNYLFGVSNRDAKIHSDIFYYSQFTLTSPKTSVINTDGYLYTKSWTAFGEVSAPLFDGKLTPLVGLAYFEDDRSTTGIDRASGAPTATSAKWHSWNPRFNLKYKPADNGTVYFNAAKGFRSGSLQTPAQAAAANVTLGLPAGTISTANQPDHLWTYELGTRWELADRRFLVEASAFHTDWSDVLVQFATAAVISITNAGDAKIDGVDLALAWRTPIDGLTVQANGNYNKTKFTRVRGALSAGTAIRVDGPIPNVPKSNFTVALDYEHGTSLLGGATFMAYGAYAFRNKQYDATTAGLASGTLEDVTLRAGFRKDGWKAEAFVTNALNDDSASSVNSTSLQILYPRRIGVTLGLAF